MLSRLLGLIFCIIGLCLPHRPRIWFSELLGWMTQGVYYLYYGLMNYLLSELRKGDRDKKPTTGIEATGTAAQQRETRHD